MWHLVFMPGAGRCYIYHTTYNVGWAGTMYRGMHLHTSYPLFYLLSSTGNDAMYACQLILPYNVYCTYTMCDLQYKYLFSCIFLQEKSYFT
jgi:hypothetical protein